MATLTAENISLPHAGRAATGQTARIATPKGLKWLLTRMITACAVYTERRALRNLSDEQLRDIGITRQQANREINRGFFDTPQR